MKINQEQAEAKSLHAMTVWVNMAFLTQSRIARAIREKEPHQTDATAIAKELSWIISEMPALAQQASESSKCPFTADEATALLLSAACVSLANATSFPIDTGLELLAGAKTLYGNACDEESTPETVKTSPSFKVNLDDEGATYLTIGSLSGPCEE